MRTYFRTAWTNGCILHACHSGGNQIDLALQNNVEFPENWIEYIYHVGSSRCCHSIFSNQALLQEAKYDRRKQTVFFTSVDPRNELQKEELHDVTKP